MQMAYCSEYLCVTKLRLSASSYKSDTKFNYISVGNIGNRDYHYQQPTAVISQYMFRQPCSLANKLP